MISEFCSAFFANMGLFFSIIQYEIRRLQDSDLNKNYGIALQSSQFYNIMCTVLLVISLYIRFDLWLKWSISIDRFTKYDTVVSTG